MTVLRVPEHVLRNASRARRPPAAIRPDTQVGSNSDPRPCRFGSACPRPTSPALASSRSPAARDPRHVHLGRVLHPCEPVEQTSKMILGSPDSLRFTVVREPRRRIWSTWCPRCSCSTVHGRVRRRAVDPGQRHGPRRTCSDRSGASRALPSVGLARTTLTGHARPIWADQPATGASAGSSGCGRTRSRSLRCVAERAGRFLRTACEPVPAPVRARRARSPRARGARLDDGVAFGYDHAGSRSTNAAWHTAVNAADPSDPRGDRAARAIADLRRMVREGDARRPRTARQSWAGTMSHPHVGGHLRAGHSHLTSHLPRGPARPTFPSRPGGRRARSLVG